jgi:hypothetical protein
MVNERLIEITVSTTAATVTGLPNALTGVPPVSVQIVNDATASSSPQSTVAGNGSFSVVTPAVPGHHLRLTATDVAGRRTERKLGHTFGATTTRVANATLAGDALYRSRRVASDGNITVASPGSFHATTLGASTRLMLFRQPNASEPPAVVSNVAGGVNDIEISNGHLYIASDRLSAISLSDPAFTVRNPVGDVCGRDGAVAVSGSHAFTSMIDCFGDAEINIWDLANPAIPRFVRNVGTGVSLTYRGLAALGSSYLIGFSSVRDISIIDRTNLNATPLPRIAELQIDAFDAFDGVVDGTMLYVAGYDGGVAIVDVSNPLAPVLRSVVRSIGSVRAVAVSGPNEIVAATGNGVTFINVTDKANPIVTGLHKLDSVATDVYVVGNTIYVAGDTSVHTIVKP